MNSREKFLIFVSILVISTLFVPTINNIQVTANQKTAQQILTQSYTASVPLLISNDLELAVASTSGDGSSSTPYVIEGLNITSSATNLISISGTTGYFIIRNNLFNANGSTSFYAILTTNVDNGVINNNTIYQSKGVYIVAGSNFVIANNSYNQGFSGFSGIRLCPEQLLIIQ